MVKGFQHFLDGRRLIFHHARQLMPQKMSPHKNSQRYLTFKSHSDCDIPVEDYFAHFDHLSNDSESTSAKTTLRQLVNRISPVRDRAKVHQNRASLLSRYKYRLPVQKELEYIEERLSTVDQLYQQSHVEKAMWRGKLLVDAPQFRHAFHVWEHILKLRAQIDQDDGIKAVWKGFRSRNLKLPVTGPAAYGLWSIFIEAGVRDQEFMLQIWSHARQLYNRNKGRKLSAFYTLVVSRLMLSNPKIALLWHNRIRKTHWSQDNAIIFHQHVNDISLLPSLQEIDSLVQNDHLYSVMIPYLAARGLFLHAKRWHKLLLQNHQKPLDSSAANLLAAYLVQYDSSAGLRALLSDFTQANIPLASSTLLVLLSYKPNIKKVLSLVQQFEWVIEGETQDDLLAKLTSYHELSHQDVDIFMRHVNVTTIGAKTVSQLAKKQTGFQEFLRGAKILQAMNHAFDAALNSRIVQEAVRHGVYHSNPGVIAKLLGPGVTRIQIQEALLHSYLNVGDWARFDEVYSQLDMQTTKAWNYLLESALLRRSKLAIAQILEDMKMRKIVPLSRLVPPIVTLLLPCRQKGRHPQSLDRFDIVQCIRVMRIIVECGGNVKIGLWHEIIKRLGFTRYNDYTERLVYWLVQVYRSVLVDGCISPQDPIGHQRKDRDLYNIYNDPSSLRKMLRATPNHPLRKIFHPNVLKAFIHWGFLDNRGKPWSHSFPSTRAGTPPIPRDQRTPRKFWGVYLAKALHELGVHVDERSVIRAVRLRMRALFGSNKSERPAVRYNRYRNKLTPQQIVYGVELVWGKPIFPKIDWDNKEELEGFMGTPKPFSPSQMKRRWRYNNLTVEQKQQRKLERKQYVSFT